MDNIQFNQLNMFRAVSKHAAKYQAITDTILAFKNGIIALNTKIAAIQQTSGEQAQSISGVTTDKKVLQDALCEITFSVIAPIRAFAIVNNNNTLAEQMNLSLSDLKAIQDDEIGQDAQALLNIVNTLPGTITDYGITGAIINAWQAAINNYLPSIAKPRVAITHRASLTEDLKTLFSEANTIAKKILDPLAITFKITYPHYYTDFLNARTIVDAGTGTTRVKGICTHAATGDPIYNVKVRMNEPALEVHTDVEGLYEQPLSPATITCTVTADGFQPQTTPAFAVPSGATITKDFSLVPV